jgi:hypothetical protein
LYQAQKTRYAQNTKPSDSVPGIGQVLYGKYANLSDSELEKKTLETARVLRDWIRANREQEIQLRSRCDRELAAAPTKDASASIRKKCLEESDLALARLISQYEQQYKAEVILLREQLIKRVSGSASPKEALMFWYPTNTLGLEQVASGLELLAKQLPHDKAK